MPNTIRPAAEAKLYLARKRCHLSVSDVGCVRFPKGSSPCEEIRGRLLSESDRGAVKRQEERRDEEGIDTDRGAREKETEQRVFEQFTVRISRKFSSGLGYRASWTGSQLEDPCSASERLTRQSRSDRESRRQAHGKEDERVRPQRPREAEPLEQLADDERQHGTSDSSSTVCDSGREIALLEKVRRRERRRGEEEEGFAESKHEAHRHRESDERVGAETAK